MPEHQHLTDESYFVVAIRRELVTHGQLQVRQYPKTGRVAVVYSPRVEDVMAGKFVEVDVPPNWGPIPADPHNPADAQAWLAEHHWDLRELGRQAWDRR